MPLDVSQRRYESMMQQLRRLYRIAERLDRNETERYGRALYMVEMEIASLESETAAIMR